MPTHESICHNGKVPFLQGSVPISTSLSASQSGISHNVLRDIINCRLMLQEDLPGKGQKLPSEEHTAHQEVLCDPAQHRPQSMGGVSPSVWRSADGNNSSSAGNLIVWTEYSRERPGCSQNTQMAIKHPSVPRQGFLGM